MNFRKLARDWLPPAVVDMVRRARAPRGPGDWEYRPEGWRADAAEVGGWNVESIRDAQLRTWPDFVRLAEGSGPLGINHTDLVPNSEDHGAHNTVMSFAYVLALAAAGRSAVSLLDWGGGIGHYGVLSRSLLPHTQVDYYCKDVPLLCAGGRSVLPEATFFEQDEACSGRTYDLVLASSSLHYSEDWRATLALLAKVTGRYLYVTRLPVVQQAPSYVVVQRPHACGYHTEYQGWFLNREALLGAADSLGLALVREFLIDERPPVPNAPEQAGYRGFLFRPAGVA
jgi:putative methyltransferase (TIGR04325 family)